MNKTKKKQRKQISRGGKENEEKIKKSYLQGINEKRKIRKNRIKQENERKQYIRETKEISV